MEVEQEEDEGSREGEKKGEVGKGIEQEGGEGEWGR